MYRTNNTNHPLVEIKSFDLIGTALTCKWEFHDVDMIDHMITKDEIKQRMVHQISAKMIELNLIEFTKSEDINTGLASFRARAFVLPDNQVKTLRIEKLI